VGTQLEEKKAAWDPNTDANATDTDAFKTVFVGRLHYDVTTELLEKEFEVYGPVKSCKLMKDKDGKSRGMAFVEFEHESDMHSASTPAARSTSRFTITFTLSYALVTCPSRS
jgi:U1 small nuclear ribonucleoprotein